MDVQGPDPGATLSLNAIGKQDTYLLNEDPIYSPFKYSYDRHSNFTKFHRSTTISKPNDAKSTWPFGESIKVTLNPRNMGDLLSNMYISIKFPKLASAGFYLADQLGRHLIKSVTMRVDEVEVETYYDDWGIIYVQMYLDASEKRTKRFLINRNLAEDTSILNHVALDQKDSDILIPIPLFFSRKYEGDEYDSNKPNRPYFPTCAIHKQKIEFEIKFRPKTFFTNSSPEDITLNSFDLITEEMTVSDEERIFLSKRKQIFVTDIVKRHPVEETEIGAKVVRLQLVPNIPVKTLFWFLRDKDYEDETVAGGGTSLSQQAAANMHNRYNFSTVNVFDASGMPIDTHNYPIIDSAKIFINGEDLPNLPRVDHTYYKYVVPHNNRLSRTERNIYTDSFAMNPINVEPSGSLDFSQLKSERTVLEINLKTGLTKTYVVNLYYVGYQTYTFEGGFMSLAY